jgi:S-(hydroxymethyl)glutathione dehydrogenase/alcohol dehydrogenase
VQSGEHDQAARDLIGGADYTIDAPATSFFMRQAAVMLASRLGRVGDIGCGARRGPRSHGARSTRDGTPVEGHRLRRGARAHGRAQDRRLVHDGKIEIDPMITHLLRLEDINKGFDLMHAGESIRSVVVY